MPLLPPPLSGGGQESTKLEEGLRVREIVLQLKEGRNRVSTVESQRQGEGQFLIWQDENILEQTTSMHVPVYIPYIMYNA